MEIWVSINDLKEMFENRSKIFEVKKITEKIFGNAKPVKILDIDKDKGLLVRAEENPKTPTTHIMSFLKFAYTIFEKLGETDEMPEWADGIVFDITMRSYGPAKTSKFAEDEFYSKVTWSRSQCSVSWDTYKRALKEFSENDSKAFLLMRDGTFYAVDVKRSSHQYDVYKIVNEIG